MNEGNSPGGENKSMDDLLAQKEALENQIKDQYTRHITVMFTDLKGSTAIADLQGDLAARMIIKKHMDILIPIFKENNGILVKTMGDGTMSYFEKEVDAVRAGLKIQMSINAYNDTIEGQSAIRIRVGVSSGKGIVEDNDIFGDVVNVASRYESSCEPAEIYIAEETFEGLGEFKDDFFIRHIRNITFKGKSTPSKVFKVFYKPEEIEKEKANPTNPDAPAAGEPQAKAEGIERLGRTVARTQRSASLSRSRLHQPKKAGEKEEASGAVKEVQGRIIKKGDIIRLSNEKIRILGDLIVVRGAVLMLDNVEFYFAENAGIIVMGVIRAKKSTFTAIDQTKGWRNLTISSQGDKASEIDNCKFHFGKGRTLENLKTSSDIAIASPQKNLTYGGGLFISGGTSKTLQIKQTEISKTSTNEGGGIFLYRSGALLDNCTFESCMAKTGNGGGIATFGSDVTINKCALSKCSSGKNGGGASFTSSKNTMVDTVFRSCLSKLGGGGLACISSSPLVNDCRFERCTSAKRGGGVYTDPKSKPTIACVSYEHCKPDNIV